MSKLIKKVPFSVCIDRLEDLKSFFVQTDKIFSEIDFQ